MSKSRSELVDRGPSAGLAGAPDERPSPVTVGGCREERRSLPLTLD